MEPGEKEDLEKLHTDMAREDRGILSFLRTLNKASRAQLDQMGYNGKTNAEAMRMAFGSYLKMYDKLIQNHVRKYPD